MRLSYLLLASLFVVCALWMASILLDREGNDVKNKAYDSITGQGETATIQDNNLNSIQPPRRNTFNEQNRSVTSNEASKADFSATREDLAEAILKLSVRYDDEGAALIAPYLRHKDFAVRKLALNGIVETGMSSGAHFIIDASVDITDPEERQQFHEAADYLQIPTWRELNRINPR